MKIGVFGGTFDPIHFGHLGAAEATRRTLRLAKIIFVPAGEPWLKAELRVSPAHDRLQMVRLALIGKRRFEVSTSEIDRPGPTYTVDTLAMLQREMGKEVKLYLLVGSDALSDFPRWKEPARVMEMCQLVAFGRPGFPLPSLKELEAAVPGISGRITFVQVPQADISATEIRRLATQGLSISHLVPSDVERYIANRGLYRDPSR